MAYTRRNTNKDATWARAWTADAYSDLASIAAIGGTDGPHHGDIAYVTDIGIYFLWLDNNTWAPLYLVIPSSPRLLEDTIIENQDISNKGTHFGSAPINAYSGDFLSTLRVGPSGTGSIAPVEFVTTSDSGIAVTSTSTGAAGTVEIYNAGFMKDAGGTLQKIGATAFQWTDKNTTNGYASWNVHTTYFSSGTHDSYALAVWANAGAAFFPTDLTSTSAPGNGILKVNGNFTTTGSITAADTISYLSNSNALLTALSMRNTNAGTAAITRFRIGNDASAFAFTIDMYGSNYTGAANHANFINQMNAPLNIGGWGVTAISMGNSGAIKFATYGAGTLQTDASGNVTAVSDIRFKKQVSPLPYGLNEILKLNPIQYKYNEISGLDQIQIYAGFSAQDVQKVIPLAVSENSQGYLTLSDRPILGALVNAIQSLTQTIELLKDKIDSLDKEIILLKSKKTEMSS